MRLLCHGGANLQTLLLLQGLAEPEGMTLTVPLLAVAAILMWGLFGTRMRRVADPLVPVGIFRERTLLFVPLGRVACHGADDIPAALFYAGARLQRLQGGAVLLTLVIGTFAPPRLLLRNPAYSG